MKHVKNWSPCLGLIVVAGLAVLLVACSQTSLDGTWKMQSLKLYNQNSKKWRKIKISNSWMVIKNNAVSYLSYNGEKDNPYVLPESYMGVVGKVDTSKKTLNSLSKKKYDARLKKILSKSVYQNTNYRIIQNNSRETPYKESYTLKDTILTIKIKDAKGEQISQVTYKRLTDKEAKQVAKNFKTYKKIFEEHYGD